MRTAPFLLLFAAVALANVEAHADPPAPAGKAQASPAAQAADLFRRGNTLYDAGKFAEALVLYREAWSLSKTWDIASNLGAVELDLGKHRDAAEHLAYGLREYPAGGKASKRQTVQQRLQEARAQVGAVRIQVNVEGAEVLIDGVSVGRAPIAEELFVDVGARKVEARLPSYVTATATVDAKKGATDEVKLDLAPVPVPTVTASATASATADVAPSRSLVPAYVMGGVGVASVIGGGLLLGIGFGKRADVLAQEPKDASGLPVCHQFPPANGLDTDPRCAGLRASAAEGATLANVGVALLALGGATAVVTVAYVLWPAKTKSVSRVVPLASTTGGALLWSGSF